MNILVVFSHFDESSLTHQFYSYVVNWLKKAGHTVKARNLYKLDFNPILTAQELEDLARTQIVSKDVAREQAYVKWAELIVFIYPIWWWNHPAILKGWIDRVLTKGFAYTSGPEGTRGLLSDKRALVIQTAGIPASFYPIGEKFYLFKKAMTEGVLAFCGIRDVYTLTLNGLFVLKPNEFSERLHQIDYFLEKRIPSNVKKLI